MMDYRKEIIDQIYISEKALAVIKHEASYTEEQLEELCDIIDRN